MNQLSDLAKKHNADSILTVRLDIGRLSGIVIDSFEFGFEVLSKDNPLTQKAKLIISIIEPEIQCIQCQTNVTQNTGQQSCSKCGTTDYRSLGGDELILAQVEME